MTPDPNHAPCRLPPRLAARLILAWLALTPLFTQPALAAHHTPSSTTNGLPKYSPFLRERAGARGSSHLDLTISGITTDSPVRSRRTLEQSPIVSRHPIGGDKTTDVRLQPDTPWYKTTWGIAGIGVAVTAATLPLDRDINRFAQRHISYSFRNNIPLNVADALTDASLAFAGATLFQSPWSSAKLAHASSVAATATFITTAAVFGLKFAFGRQRPGGPGSSPYEFHPFSSRYDVISGGSIIKLGRGQTASFPSGHTAVAFSIITPYAEIYHNPWLYAIPVTVGISRIIAVDGHWASDVVAGGLLGWLTADLTRRFFPDSDFGLMIFGEGVEMHKSF